MTAEVLAVDLDGALIATDVLHEQFRTLALARPVTLLHVLVRWGARGFDRVWLKRELATIEPIRPESLPYREAILDVVRRARANGVRVVLATATHERLAGPIASHLGQFDAVLATDDTTNLKGAVKGAALRAFAPSSRLTYVGHSWADLAVWRSCDAAVVVNGSPALRSRVRELGITFNELRIGEPAVRTLLRQLRPLQWIKNTLVFAPMVAAHQLADPEALRSAFLAFVTFSLMASAAYVVNDLTDLLADRAHPTNRRRPLPSGDLSIVGAAALLVALLSLATAIGVALPLRFGLVLLAYLVVNLAYSLRLKEMLGVDVILLSGMYVSRVVAGSEATATPISPWFLGFAGFLFVGLALLKRYVALRAALTGGAEARREYSKVDEPVILASGVVSSLMALVVLALYLASAQVRTLYSHPVWITLLQPVLFYWVLRMWLLAHRGGLPSDPVMYALRDRAFWWTVLVATACVVLAT